MTTSRYMLLVYGLLGGLLPVGGIQAQQPPALHVALAGTMEQVISRQIGPAFTAATGYNLDVTRAASVALANRIAVGELKPDVYISSDANVMELVMGPANNDGSRWFLPILRSRTVILHSPQSRFNSDFELVREGKLPWYEVIQRPGLVLSRIRNRPTRHSLTSQLTAEFGGHLTLTVPRRAADQQALPRRLVSDRRGRLGRSSK